MSSSKFDIVVYGATGFTGQLVAEYLAAHYKGDGNLKWAMAGRSLRQARLGARRDRRAGRHAADRGRRRRSRVAEGDGRPDQIGDHDGRARISSTATNWSRPASASGTDYFDLCGEPLWMRQMIDAHEAAAKASGARIVFSCGYRFAAVRARRVLCAGRQRRRLFGAPVSRVKGRVREMSGTISGGTAASMQGDCSTRRRRISAWWRCCRIRSC